MVQEKGDLEREGRRKWEDEKGMDRGREIEKQKLKNV